MLIEMLVNVPASFLAREILIPLHILPDYRRPANGTIAETVLVEADIIFLVLIALWILCFILISKRYGFSLTQGTRTFIKWCWYALSVVLIGPALFMLFGTFFLFIMAAAG